MGLLNVMRKRFESAKQNFNRTLLAKNPREENRTLFWRGYLENGLDSIPATLKWSAYWERLVLEYPLTQHAVLAHSIFGEHPIAQNSEKAPLPLSPHLGTLWDAPNLTNFIFLNFMAQNDKRAGREFSSRIEGKVTSTNIGPAMFLAAAHRSVENYRESMRVMYAAVKATGSSALHPEIMKLLYPTLFLKEVSKNSGNIEVPLVLSLMRQESSFNKHAQSPRGAMGLMQILPSTARGTTRRKSAPLNLLDPNDNVKAGCKYLSQQIQKFNGNEVPTLAAYNAGPTVATRWMARYAAASPLLYADLIPYPETRAYVSGILRGRFWYRYLLGSNEAQSATTQELAYAEHLLSTRLAPDIASRSSPTSVVTFLARESLSSADESEEYIYNEEF
jgi:soluble lytic murein transglycosylase-like protein